MQATALSVWPTTSNSSFHSFQYPPISPPPSLPLSHSLPSQHTRATSDTHLVSLVYEK